MLRFGICEQSMKPETIALLLICLGQFISLEVFGATDSIEFEEIELLVESNTRGDRLYKGYTPHSFTINNYGSEERTITFTLPALPEFEPFKVNALSQTFTVSPGVHSVTVYQPPIPLSSLSNEVLIQAEGIEGVIESGWEARIQNFRNTGYLQTKSILVARSQNQTQLEDAYKAQMVAALGQEIENFVHANFVTEEKEIEDWPANWLAYSGYHAIAVSDEEWARAGINIQMALLNWAMAGGSLNIIAERQEGVATHHNEIGMGRLERITVPANPANTPAENSTAILQSSLAQTLLHNTENWMPLLGGMAEGVIKMHEGESSIFRDESGELLDEPTYNDYFKIVEDAKAPVVFVVTMLTLFLILAGPVNLYVLNRLNKRTWFLWTLPALSLGTSVIIFTVAFLGEGIQSTIRTDSVTFLDQESHQAFTVGGLAAYSPVSIPRLEFNGNTEVTPLINWRTSDSGANRRVEWQKDGSQWFTGKWVPSRIPTFFALRKVENRKERLAIEWDAPEPFAENKLGVKLTKLLACSPEGKVYSAKDIVAGDRAKLKLLGQIEKEDAVSIKQLMKMHLKQMDLMEFDGPNPSEIPLDSYWAVMEDASPFLENPVTFKKSKHIHVGHLIGKVGEGRK